MSYKKNLLDKVKFPKDLKKFKDSELKQVSKELRDEVIDAVSVTGGHLGAGLGVVELTVAIHSVFNTPKDKLIWDVGHQCYPHKVITGRREKLELLDNQVVCMVLQKDLRVITIHLQLIHQHQYLLA